MIDINFKYTNLIKYFEEKSLFRSDLAIVLGSGLGDFIHRTDVKRTLLTTELPGYPPSTIEGHAGKIHFAEYEGKKLLLFQGRTHLYEGYKIYECILPVLMTYRNGCRKILLTNAAGSVNLNLHPGDLMLINSFIAFNLKKELTELIGLAGKEEKDRMLNFPSSSLNSKIKNAASEEKIDLKEGVYWYSKGPSYETPSEIRMARTCGGDAVGMSTVNEAWFASYLGLEISAISCITNYGAGISQSRLSHTEVTQTADMVKGKFERLLKRIISLI